MRKPLPPASPFGCEAKKAVGAVQGLLDVADEVKQVTQTHRLVAETRGAALQRGDGQVDGLDDVK